MEVIGIDNLDKTRHFVMPVKHIRYAVVEKDINGVQKFYCRALGMDKRIEISELMFEEIRKAMLEE